MSVEEEQPFSDIEATLKKSAAALRGAGVRHVAAIAFARTLGR